MKLFVIGYPGDVGGANTELWHTLKLWRAAGWEIHLVPTWGEPAAAWREKVTAIGCATHVVSGPKREELEAIPGLAGGVVFSMCNELFLTESPLFRRLDCKIVWSNCMNWLFAQERRQYPLFGPFDAYHCQSRYQIAAIGPLLQKYGVKRRQLHLIRGAFDVEEFPFNPRPHGAGEAFVCGRLSRASIDKHSTNTWPILRRVNYNPFRYRVMGWTDPVRRAIGDAPEWAETLPPGKLPASEFLRSLHCYCQISGHANENWPRTGLEAMAAGVPIVVEDRGGWREMIRHRTTGFLCKSDAELAHWTAQLAWDEDFRLSIAAKARRRLEQLANPEKILDGWRRLFVSIT